VPLPDFTQWPSFPFEGDLRVKKLDDPVADEPPRAGEDAAECSACGAPDEAYIWVSERWRVRAMDRPTGLPMVLILESRSHLDLGDLPNLLAAELGVMTVRLERAIRSLDGVARVHVNRWGDGSAHLHIWFLARPRGRVQLRGTFLSLWDDILPPIPEGHWRENLAHVAAWLAEFGGRPLAAPPRIEWKAPSRFNASDATATTGAAWAKDGGVAAANDAGGVAAAKGAGVAAAKGAGVAEAKGAGVAEADDAGVAKASESATATVAAAEPR
jgi:diadenosine tetraphosphate (Ap4A) HIT family hydrolase